MFPGAQGEGILMEEISIWQAEYGGCALPGVKLCAWRNIRCHPVKGFGRGERKAPAPRFGLAACPARG